MTFKYGLQYEYDSPKSSPKTYESEVPVSAGDVIFHEEDGLFYYVSQVLQQTTRVRLRLSKSSQSEAEARLVAAQLRQSK